MTVVRSKRGKNGSLARLRKSDIHHRGESSRGEKEKGRNWSLGWVRKMSRHLVTGVGNVGREGKCVTDRDRPRKEVAGVRRQGGTEH